MTILEQLLTVTVIFAVAIEVSTGHMDVAVPTALVGVVWVLWAIADRIRDLTAARAHDAHQQQEEG